MSIAKSYCDSFWSAAFYAALLLAFCVFGNQTASAQQGFCPDCQGHQIQGHQIQGQQIQTHQFDAGLHGGNQQWSNAGCNCAQSTHGQHGQQPGPFKFYCGVNEYTAEKPCARNNWSNGHEIPWEQFGPGEYIGPHRTPHINEYRLRVGDQIEFVFQANRAQTAQQYRLSIGDTIRVVSATDERVNIASQENGLSIMSDGTVSLDIIGTVFAANRTISELQEELNTKYAEFFDSEPRITVTGIRTDTKLSDFLNSVDARAGSGGQSRNARVTVDGTLRLPLIGAVRVVGLTLDELEREVNSRFNVQVPGVHVSVVLSEQAPRFAYVMGEVDEPGRFELDGPTTVTQAIALAGGWLNGGNLRQIVVFRRDNDWRLMALRINLKHGLNGLDPVPVDEIWLRDSDVVLIPKRPIVHIADAIELYFTRTLYALFPSELGVFDAQSVNAN